MAPRGETFSWGSSLPDLVRHESCVLAFHAQSMAMCLSPSRLYMQQPRCCVAQSDATILKCGASEG